MISLDLNKVLVDVEGNAIYNQKLESTGENLTDEEKKDIQDIIDSASSLSIDKKNDIAIFFNEYSKKAFKVEAFTIRDVIKEALRNRSGSMDIEQLAIFHEILPFMKSSSSVLEINDVETRDFLIESVVKCPSIYDNFRSQVAIEINPDLLVRKKRTNL